MEELTLKKLKEARKIVNYIESLPDFRFLDIDHRTYGHMGATLTDAGLQAGIRYKTVVLPRVHRLIAKWPNAKTSSGFLCELRKNDSRTMFEWNHPEKPRRILDMVILLVDHKIETENELATWIDNSGNRKLLQQIPGVGPKTADYLRKLVGGSSLAIDRHLKNFALKAGVESYGYGETEKIFRFAADMLGVNCRSLDDSIWTYIASP